MAIEKKVLEETISKEQIEKNQDKGKTILVCQEKGCEKECTCEGGKDDNDSLKPDPKPQVKTEEVDQPQPEKKLELSLDAINGFMNIVGVIMVNDVRGDSLITHFQNMLIQQNPEIKLNPVPVQQ